MARAGAGPILVLACGSPVVCLGVGRGCMLLAVLYRWHGLAAVAGFGACVLCAGAVVMFCWLVTARLRPVDRRRGHLGGGERLEHPLSGAAAHLFPAAFPVSLVDAGEDRRRKPSPQVWWLVPLAALWANLHAGFAAWLAVLGLAAAVAALDREPGAGDDRASYSGCPRRPRCSTLMAGGCTLTLPAIWARRGFRKVCRSSSRRASARKTCWCSQHCCSPGVGAGLAAVAGRTAIRRPSGAGMGVRRAAFGAPRATLRRSRRACDRWRVRGVVAGPGRGASVLAPRFLLGHGAAVAAALEAHTVDGGSSPAAVRARTSHSDFPDERFPITAVAECVERLAPSGRMPRILTSDQWADYLIFRLYPRQRVFFDGRSDFYGPALGADYQSLFRPPASWREALERHSFDIALLPADWPLAAVLEHEPGWQGGVSRRTGTLLVRAAAGRRRRQDARRGRETAMDAIASMTLAPRARRWWTIWSAAPHFELDFGVGGCGRTGLAPRSAGVSPEWAFAARRMAAGSRVFLAVFYLRRRHGRAAMSS